MKRMIWDGQGPVFLGKYDPDNGTPEMGYLTGLYQVGCGTRTLTTTPSVERSTISESCTGQRLPLAQLTSSRSLAVSLSMQQFDGRTLAKALSSEHVEKAAGTVSDEVLPPLEPGDYFFLKHPHVSSVVIEDSTTATPLSYIEGTHYLLEDAAHGRCKLIEHPASHVAPVKVDYEYAAYGNIAAFSAEDVQTGIIFNGTNQEGHKGRVIIPRLNLAMGGDFGWITDEAASLELSGEALFVPELENDPDYGPFMRVDALPV